MEIEAQIAGPIIEAIYSRASRLSILKEKLKREREKLFSLLKTKVLIP